MILTLDIILKVIAKLILFRSEVRHGFDDDIVSEEKKISKEKKEPENEKEEPAFLRCELVN